LLIVCLYAATQLCVACIQSDDELRSQQQQQLQQQQHVVDAMMQWWNPRPIINRKNKADVPEPCS
jgi:hypothetical protein